MLRLVVFCLLGACLPLTLAFPSSNAAVTTSTPVPTKYAACKTFDCPPFRVVERFTSDVELREYSESFWISAEAEVPEIDRNVTSHLYWRLRGYIRKSNLQLQTQKRKFCSTKGGRTNANMPAVCQKQELKTGVPVTRLIEQIKTGTKGTKVRITMSLYLSSPSPPPPPYRHSKVSLDHYKSLLVYVKVFKGRPFYNRLGEPDARQLASELDRFDGTTFYAPDTKYMTAGYDDPWVPRNERTNEVWLFKKPSSALSTCK